MGSRSNLDERASIFQARRVEKPWGSELVFAEIDDVYVGKIISVNRGASLSLQYHNEKMETISVVSGIASVEYGSNEANLEECELTTGGTIHLPAGALHRITAVEDLVFAEVSTAHSGWRDDVIRLDDRYGRQGTSAP